MQVFPNGSIPVVMAGRFLGGLAVGVLSLVVPVYLSEMAPAGIRGRLVGGFDIGIQVRTRFRSSCGVNVVEDATLD